VTDIVRIFFAFVGVITNKQINHRILVGENTQQGKNLQLIEN